MTEQTYSTTLDFEPHSFKNITGHLDTLGMKAKVANGGVVYRGKGETMVFVKGDEGAPGKIIIVNVSEEIKNGLEKKVGGVLH